MEKAYCDIIIPIFNKRGMTDSCLKTIYENTHIPFKLILIDNGSDAETRNFLEEMRSSNANIELIRNDRNVGWVKAANQGIGRSSSRYVCIMNNDTLVRTDNWLSRLIKVAESEDDIGLVNPYFKAKEKTRSKDIFTEVDFCRGYAVLIKRALIEKIGLLDESYELGYYDDVDYSVRAIRAGFKCLRANDVFVEHLRDMTFSTVFDSEKRMALFEKNKRLFTSKWGASLRLLFLMSNTYDKETLSDIFFTLARRQHIVYIWNRTGRAGLLHINIREKKIGRLFHGLAIALMLYINRLKKKTKQYDLIFVDNKRLNIFLSSVVANIHYVDIETDGAKIYEMVDKASRCEKPARPGSR